MAKSMRTVQDIMSGEINVNCPHIGLEFELASRMESATESRAEALAAMEQSSCLDSFRLEAFANGQAMVMAVNEVWRVYQCVVDGTMSAELAERQFKRGLQRATEKVVSLSTSAMRNATARAEYEAWRWLETTTFRHFKGACRAACPADA